jgi:Sulfotransferase family/Tetratricopeptide repeat
MATTITARLEQAWSLLQQDGSAKALELALGVLAAEPDNVSALACHAMALWAQQGRNHRSLEVMARAVSLAPGVAPLRYNYANLLNGVGRLDEAAEQFRAALKINPDDPQAFGGLTRNTKITSRDEIVERMERLFASGASSGLDHEGLAFGLAKAFDDLNVPDKAMAYASEANRLAGRSWNVAYADGQLADLQALSAQDAFRTFKTSGHPTRAPLFIVGMPRSGTTLIETILSRHPDVLALGEAKQVPSVLREAQVARKDRQRFDVGAELSRDWLGARAERIVKGWSQSGRQFGVVTDKMPDNVFTLGLIRQLFPKARVIYARRHPLDTGISNFFNRYAEGQGFSYRLDWIGLRTRQVSETMDIWKRGLDLEILDVSYERLVADPETEIRRMAAFAGLTWTDDFLTPEQSARRAETASQWQVRQPIYKSSVARWKRYEPWIGPMIEAMGGLEWVERGAAAGR